jgi:hypothetical protein
LGKGVFGGGLVRGIVKELRFEAELSAIEPDARRADEFVEAAEWALGRDPTQGWLLGSCVWFLPMSDVPDAPRLDLYYTFDDERVYFLSIQIAP